MKLIVVSLGLAVAACTDPASATDVAPLTDSTPTLIGSCTSVATHTALGASIVLNLNEEAIVSTNAPDDTVYLCFDAYDASSGRDGFAYEEIKNGQIIDSHVLYLGPQDIGFELEVVKATSLHTMVSVAASSRWPQ